MARPSQREYYDKLDALRTAQASRIARAYSSLVNRLAVLAVPLQLNSNGEFYFRNYPSLNKAVNALIQELYTSVYGYTTAGANGAWDLGTDVNNDLNSAAFANTDISLLNDSVRETYFGANLGARRSFVLRKETGGFSTSDKVWRNNRQLKQQLELSLEAGLSQGTSAQNLAKEIKQYLVDPDKLFRRIRSKENGTLRLSKSALAYKPGRGRYRSSVKNALRLARNEINFSYEQSNGLKRQQSSFIVGVKITVSPSHNRSDDRGGISCYALQGNYPKDFDFTYKWHTSCKCRSLNILKSREEMDKDIDRLLEGKGPLKSSKNKVYYLPGAFTGYISRNSDLWSNWSNKPRFLSNLPS